jgi:hypothetical protein
MIEKQEIFTCVEASPPLPHIGDTSRDSIEAFLLTFAV